MRKLGSPFRDREAATVVAEDAPLVEEEELLPPPPPPSRPRPPLLWPWLLLLLLLVLGGLLAAWLLTRDDGGSSASTVNVPNVVRLKQQEAVARLNRRGLVARVVTRASSAAAGTVVAQDPGPGADVTRRSVVTLSVSSIRTEAVPDVVGQTAQAAVAALQAKGFRVQTRNVASKKKSGTVLAQSPLTGSKVGRGSTVTITISRGLVAVPSTIGQSRDTALATVRGAGLVPRAFTVPSTQPKGTVVAQKPRAGARVPGGSTVRLNVSNGAGGGAAPPPPPPPPPPAPPASVTVPDVTGQQQDAAQRQLNSAGLKTGVVWVPSDEPEGTVVSQSPAAGTTQTRAKRIQLNVSLGPSPDQQAVPNVVGLDPATAQSRLESAGFTVQTLRQPVGDRSQVGKVVDEQTAGGRRAPAGSVVVIYVGRAV